MKCMDVSSTPLYVQFLAGPDADHTSGLRCTPKNAARRTPHSGSLALTPARHTRLFFSEINYLSSYFLIPPFRPLLHLGGGGHCRKGESERAREGRPNISATPLSNSATHKLEKHTRTGSSWFLSRTGCPSVVFLPHAFVRGRDISPYQRWRDNSHPIISFFKAKGADVLKDNPFHIFAKRSLSRSPNPETRVNDLLRSLPFPPTRGFLFHLALSLARLGNGQESGRCPLGGNVSLFPSLLVGSRGYREIIIVAICATYLRTAEFGKRFLK